MNTWGYLILIAALFIVAALMLYARFASRSREKSLHHAPAETKGEDDLPEIFVGEEVISESEVPEPEVDAPVEVVPVEDAPAEDLVEEIEEENLAIKVEKQEPEEQPVEEKEYFDELQEAAAGLAMLMRSSPVSDRATPVVFAPEEEEVIAIEKIDPAAEEVAEIEVSKPIEGGEEALPAAVEEVVEESSPAAQEEAVGAVESVSPPAEPGDEISEEVAPDVESGESSLSLVEILGDEVNEQILRIDAGLDALEDLVASIEGGLAELEPLHSELDSLEEEEISGDAVAVEVAA